MRERGESHTSVETHVAFLPDDSLQTAVKALLRSILTGHMHPALDGDVRICDRSGEDLAQGTKVECILGSDPSPALQDVLQLFEDGVLQDRVDHQHQRRKNTSKKSLGAFLVKKLQQRPDGRWLLLGRRARQGWLLDVGLASSHAGVNNPDGVGDQNRCTASESTSNHRFDGGELLRGPAGPHSGLLKRSPRPFIPIVVHEIGDTDSKQCRIQARVEASDTLPLHNPTHRIEGCRMGTFRLDLCSRGKGDQRITGMRRNTISWLSSNFKNRG